MAPLVRSVQPYCMKPNHVKILQVAGRPPSKYIGNNTRLTTYCIDVNLAFEELLRRDIPYFPELPGLTILLGVSNANNGKIYLP
eukprot:scaffold43563_cov14-Prasinocladus_malaysianus.AAC.1